MNKASEIIEQIDRELSFIELGIHFPITGKFIKEKITKLKELTEWTAFEDREPENNKEYWVKYKIEGCDEEIMKANYVKPNKAFYHVSSFIEVVKDLDLDPRNFITIINPELDDELEYCFYKELE